MLVWFLVFVVFAISFQVFTYVISITWPSANFILYRSFSQASPFKLVLIRAAPIQMDHSPFRILPSLDNLTTCKRYRIVRTARFSLYRLCSSLSKNEQCTQNITRSTNCCVIQTFAKAPLGIAMLAIYAFISQIMLVNLLIGKYCLCHRVNNANTLHSNDGKHVHQSER